MGLKGLSDCSNVENKVLCVRSLIQLEKLILDLRQNWKKINVFEVGAWKNLKNWDIFKHGL